MTLEKEEKSLREEIERISKGVNFPAKKNGKEVKIHLEYKRKKQTLLKLRAKLSQLEKEKIRVKKVLREASEMPEDIKRVIKQLVKEIYGELK